MATSETTTKAAPATPDEYIESIPDERRRNDIRRLHEMIRRAAPNLEPSVEAGGIGYGTYHYRYATGREGDAAIIALSSRKQYISLYVSATVGDKYLPETYVDRLPKADIGKVCVRIKRLTDVDESVLEQLIREGATTETFDHLR